MLTVCSCFWSERLIDAAKVVVLWYNSKCLCDNFTREGLIGDVLEVKLKVDRPRAKVMKVGRLVGHVLPRGYFQNAQEVANPCFTILGESLVFQCNEVACMLEPKKMSEIPSEDDISLTGS